MGSAALIFRRALLPGTVFLVVFAAHYLWLGLFPEQDPAQAGWAALPVETSWFRSYVEAQAYWMSYSYALCLAFAAWAVRSYRESRCGTTRTMAIGGLTFSGFLAATGCFLIGCCGSPMLVVWVNLFGAAFLPFAKPLIAAATTVTVGCFWLWMGRRRGRQGGRMAVASCETCRNV